MVAVRAMAIFQGFSGLPEDRFINTFHFNNPLGSWPGYAATVDGFVNDFYEHIGPSTERISEYLSPAILRPWTVNVYNLADPEPRVPEVFSHSLAAAPAQSGVGIPEEVAVTLSVHGDPPVTARRRGRIYFGPLGSSGIEISPASTSTWTRVRTQLIDDLVAAAEGLISDSAGTWCIRSTVPSENFVPIVGGWVDNAPDTQRRRGADSTLRTTFP